MLVVGVAGWAGFRAYQAARDLQSASDQVGALQAEITDGDLDAARARLARTAARTHRAHERTTGPVFGPATHLPVLGRHLRAVQRAAAAGDTITADVMEPLVDALDVARHDDLIRDGRVDHDALRTMRDRVTRASGATRLVAVSLHQPTGPLLTPVRRKLDDLTAKVDDLDAALQGASRALLTAPSMLGEAGPRHYFVAVQNNAEARASGGLIGAFAILRADHGKVTLVRNGSNRELDSVNPPVAAPRDGSPLWPRIGSDRAWFYANLSPHFPDVAQTLQALWERKTGQRVDGVLALDPVVMSTLLRPVGAVPLPDGSGQVGPKDIVPFVLHDEYLRYRDNAQRKDLLSDLAAEIFRRVLNPKDPVPALRSMVDAARSGHLFAWSAVPGEQEQIATGVVGGALPAEPSPYVQVLTQNMAGNKLDWFLRRDVTITRLDDGQVRVDVRLRCDVPPAEPGYVLGDDHPALGVPSLQASTLLSVYGAQGSGVTKVLVDGEPTDQASLETDHGHPAVSVVLTFPRGRDRVVSVTMTMPPGEVRYVQQPLGRPDRITTR